MTFPYKFGYKSSLYAVHAFEYGGVGLHLFDRDEVSSINYRLTLTRGEELKDGEYFPAPTAILQKAQTQQLFDAMWALGYRPSERWAVGGESAQQEHIKDLRRVLDRTLDAALPPRDKP